MRKMILLSYGVVLLLFGACNKPDESLKESEKMLPPTTSTEPPARYAYEAWSDWQADCSQKQRDQSLPCAAVRQRICINEIDNKPVGCDYCGGVCEERITDLKPPRYLYSKWSEWNDHCEDCDPSPNPCKADRSRFCMDRQTGQTTDCSFCGGQCKEEENRMSGCNPECKWTTIHAYSDPSCTIKVRENIFAGPWGPQTNSPFNRGCSDTQWSTQCVNFGDAYFKWEPCSPGCNPPFKK